MKNWQCLYTVATYVNGELTIENNSQVSVLHISGSVTA